MTKTHTQFSSGPCRHVLFCGSGLDTKTTRFGMRLCYKTVLLSFFIVWLYVDINFYTAAGEHVDHLVSGAFFIFMLKYGAGF